MIDERLDILSAENEMGGALNGFGEVGDEDGAWVDDRVPVDFGGATFVIGDPSGIDSEDGFHGGLAFEGHWAIGDIHGEPAAGDNFSSG